MVKIAFTNIIVDEFSTARNNPFNPYIHFLTHIHTDHLKGLSNSWGYGTIYCSAITKKLILLKFPNLFKYLKQLELEKQYTISLSSQLDVTVTLYDSNHCAGGVMILFEGYMGTILYTGDLRFDKEIFSKYSYIYPHYKRNEQFQNCSIPIDYLYLDVTFLHPRYTFPPKIDAMKMLQEFIDQTIQNAKKQNKFIEFYIGMDNFGKQQVLVNLASKFNTYITISQQRYKNISTIGWQTQIFTTNPKAGFIHVVLKRQLKEYLKEQNAMGIILTGWATKPHFRGSKIYAIPYSLHSSYTQLQEFVNSLRPSFLQSIIENNGRESKDIYSSNSRKNQNDDINLNFYESINYSQFLEQFRTKYCSQATNQIKYLMSDLELQKKINQKLNLNRSQAEINKQVFGLNTIRVEASGRTIGAKFNIQNNQQQINILKQQLKSRMGLNKTKIKQFQINSGSQNNQKNYNQNSVLIIDQQYNQSSEKSNNSSNIEQQNQANGDSQNSKKNKWKKRIQLGQIDLFSQIPVKKDKEKIKEKLNISQNNRFSDLLNQSKINKVIQKNNDPVSQNFENLNDKKVNLIQLQESFQTHKNENHQKKQRKQRLKFNKDQINKQKQKMDIQYNYYAEQSQSNRQQQSQNIISDKQIFKSITKCEQYSISKLNILKVLSEIKEVKISDYRNFFMKPSVPS